MKNSTKGRLALLVVYIIAFGLGFWVSTVSDYSILAKSAIAVGVTVMIIFMGSVDFNNSSIFDPYWSVAPPLMVIYYFALYFTEQKTGVGTGVVQLGQYSLQTGEAMSSSSPITCPIDLLVKMPRVIILLALVVWYGIRLTRNFLKGWPDLKHEDWRYVNFRKQSGKAYWIVSLSAIHLFPSLMVFGGTLSIWVVVTQGFYPLNWLDIVAVVVTAGAIVLEATADRQLRAFTRNAKEPGKTMDQGLWSISRHPNYLGEITFWWGLYLFALAANPGFWWVIIGPLAITIMFLFASIPLIEKRMLERRTDYRDYRKRVSMLLPLKWASGKK